MGKCNLCNSTHTNDIILCATCGYNFKKNEVGNRDTLLAYLSKLKKSKNWIEEVKLKKRINDIQGRKYREWSERKTSEFLEERNNVISPDIRLAEALEQYTVLLSCKSKTEAKRRLDEIKRGNTILRKTPTFRTEKNLQQYLYDNWENTPFSKEWKLQRKSKSRDGKYPTGLIGEIDLLAKSYKENKWLVIELKLARSSDETVGQILRYMGWVKENLAGEDGKAEGLILSETADVHIKYALKCVSDIGLKVYQLNNNKLEFEKPEVADVLTYMRTLSEYNKKVWKK